MSFPADKPKRFGQSLLLILPPPLRAGLRSCKRWFQARIADRLYFPVWLLFQCLRHRQRAVILCRRFALGDVICTLPMCLEIRKRHPQRLLVYVTMADYKKVVQLSPLPNVVYGACAPTFSVPHHFWGLIERIYTPRTTDELSADTGPTCHLIDDLANSCGITLTDRQPRLCPSRKLIERTCLIHGLAPASLKQRRLIAINGGHSWAVKEWSFDHWQKLVSLIHAEFDATILLFGVGGSDASGHEYARLQGVESFVNHRVTAHEMVALVAACDLVISIDSGPIHVAGAVGTPVVGLFGANNPRFRLPPASPGVGLVADVPCLFCHHLTPRGHWQTGCPHDIRCMKELDVQTVFAAVKAMLTQAA